MLNSLSALFAATRVQDAPNKKPIAFRGSKNNCLQPLSRDVVEFTARKEGKGNTVSYTAGKHGTVHEEDKTVIVKSGAEIRKIVTENGDILIKKGSKVREVETGGGNVVVEDGAKVDKINTVSGKVTLKNHASVDGEIHTVDGKVLLLADSYAYEVHTDSGNIQLNPRSEASSITTETGDVLLVGDPSSKLDEIDKEEARYTYAYDIYAAEGEIKLVKKALVDSISTDYGTVTLQSGARAGNIATDHGKVELTDDAQANVIICPEGNLTKDNTAKVGRVKYLSKKAQN
jgi:hypothetical protein